MGEIPGTDSYSIPRLSLALVRHVLRLKIVVLGAMKQRGFHHYKSHEGEDGLHRTVDERKWILIDRGSPVFPH